MRTLFFGKTAATVAVLLLLASCTGKKVSTLKMDCAEMSDEVELASDRQDLFNYNYRIEYPVSGASDEVLAKFTATILEASLGSDYMTYPVEMAVQKYKDDRVAEYKEENLDLLKQLSTLLEDEDEEDFRGDADLSWDETIEGEFSGAYKGVISYGVYTFKYEGGAHGNFSQVSVNFDEKTGDVIDEESFFIPGYEVQLGSMLSSHLSDSMENEEDYEFLFVKDIEPNGNFKVSNTGVTYIYTPYEIGPYSLGTIQVTIPWEEVAPIVAERD